MIWKYLEQNILCPKDLNWVQHCVSQMGLLYPPFEYMCIFSKAKFKYLFYLFMRLFFLRFQLYILETIVEHVIQTASVTFSPACMGPQNDSFSAISVDNDEEGKTRRVGNDLHSVKWRWREHRLHQNSQRRSMGHYSSLYTQESEWIKEDWCSGE